MKVDRTASFGTFVYPFCFSGADFDHIADSITNAVWPGRETTLKVWEPAKFPKDDLLAHVAEYLNPADDSPATARLWKLTGSVLQSNYGLGNNAEWHLVSTRTVQFHIDGVTLVLFRVGVGFVTISAKPIASDPAQWSDLVHFFRICDPEHGTPVRITKRQAVDKIAPFFPEPAGGIANHPQGEGVIGDILRALLVTGSDRSAATDWWRNIFVPGRMLPFTGLFLDGVPDEKQPEVLYRARRSFHSQQELCLTSLDRRCQHDSLYEYANNQWFAFSLDGGTFVAFDAPSTPFFRQNLPHHLQSQYFLLFLIVLHQKFALMRLSGEVAASWPLKSEDAYTGTLEQKFRDIRHNFLMFTARGYFTQVMQRENHHYCYVKWQQIFRTRELYEEVRDEVKEMHNNLLMWKTERIRELTEREEKAEKEREAAAERRAQKLQERISALGILIGVPALFIGFLGINLQGITSQEGMTWWIAFLIGGGAGLILGMLMLRVALWRIRK